MSNKSVLFVCLGNICRSPAAEGLLLHMSRGSDLEEILHVESCGLGDWHAGQLPDRRMREAAKERGIVLSSRAQEFHPDYLETFEYILAADKSVLHELYHYTTSPEHKAKMHLMTAFSTTFKDEEVPDPFYGNRADFDLVLNMLEDCCEGLLKEIRKTNME